MWFGDACRRLPVCFSHHMASSSGTKLRRLRCRGAIHRARLRTYCTLGDANKPLPRAVAAGPFAESTAAVVRNVRSLREGGVRNVCKDSLFRGCYLPAGRPGGC